MRTLIIHGRRIPGQRESPRKGREHCDLWGVTRANVNGANYWNGTLKDWTAWFDIHPLSKRAKDAKFEGIPTRRPEAYRWYCQQDGSRPIFLQHPINDEEWAAFERVPGAAIFPLEAIQNAFPLGELAVDGTWVNVPNTFFECQLGMMIAFACFLEYEHIILNGVGQYTSIVAERLHRDTLGWLFFARGRGIKVTVEGPSVYHTPKQVYAYEKLNYDELARLRKDALYGEQQAALERRREADMRRGRPTRLK